MRALRPRRPGRGAAPEPARGADARGAGAHHGELRRRARRHASRPPGRVGRIARAVHDAVAHRRREARRAAQRVDRDPHSRAGIDPLGLRPGHRQRRPRRRPRPARSHPARVAAAPRRQPRRHARAAGLERAADDLGEPARRVSRSRSRSPTPAHPRRRSSPGSCSSTLAARRRSKSRCMVSWIWQLLANPATLPDGGVDPGGRRPDATGRPARPHRDGARPRPGDSRSRSSSGPRRSRPGTKVAQLDCARRARVRAGARRRAALERPTCCRRPYVPIDATMLEAAGLGDHLPDEYAKGGEALQSVLAPEPVDAGPDRVRRSRSTVRSSTGCGGCRSRTSRCATRRWFP